MSSQQIFFLVVIGLPLLDWELSTQKMPPAPKVQVKVGRGVEMQHPEARCHIVLGHMGQVIAKEMV